MKIYIYIYTKLKDHKQIYPLFLPNFIVAYIDNAFLSMCAVPLPGFVYQTYFQDVLQSSFSLILMHQQLLEFLLFLIVTFFLPQSEDLYILIVRQIYLLFISIGNIKSISLHIFSS